MANIVGGVTSINNPRTNWAQTDAKKADYLKNKPSVANALKGHKTGAVISADDVSPVEHEIDVKVSSKNLFKMPDKITPDSNKVEIIDNSIIITNTSDNSWTGLKKNLKEVCPSLKVGDTAVLTFTSTNTSNTGKYIYLSGENKTWNNGASKTITEASLNSNVILYCFGSLNSVTTISNIQIEKGTVATEYTPYVDTKGTTVKRYGKNFFSNDTSDTSKFGEVSWNGSERIYFGYDIRLPVGTYYMHARRKSEAGQGGAYIYGCIVHKDETGTGFGYAPVADTSYTDVKVIIEDGDWLCLYDAGGMTEDAAKAVFNAYNIQIELGNKVTEFEPYDMVEAVADADGNVEGLTSHAPNMVLITDNNESVIECEYNRDANKVITDLETKLNTLIATIGG